MSVFCTTVTELITSFITKSLLFFNNFIDKINYCLTRTETKKLVDLKVTEDLFCSAYFEEKLLGIKPDGNNISDDIIDQYYIEYYWLLLSFGKQHDALHK